LVSQFHHLYWGDLIFQLAHEAANLFSGGISCRNYGMFFLQPILTPFPGNVIEAYK
jgi:hypothetical protein